MERGCRCAKNPYRWAQTNRCTIGLTIRNECRDGLSRQSAAFDVAPAANSHFLPMVSRALFRAGCGTLKRFGENLNRGGFP